MDRREFIKTGAGAFFIAATGCVSNSGVIGGAGAPSSRVRLAVLGCHAKGRGNRIMRAAMMNPGVEIAWVCDVDERARDFAAAEVEKYSGFKPRKEKDFRKVLEDPNLDGILSETPDHLHAYTAVMAMRAGKGVYVEKPCCFCPREGEILVDTWKKTGMVFQMGNQRRASYNIDEALKWLKETNAIGEIRWARGWCPGNRASIGRGKVVPVPAWLDWDLWQGPAPRTEYRDNVVHYNWHWFRRWGTAETGNNSTHFADIARWAIGEHCFPKRVSCLGGSIFPRKDDDFEWPDTYNMSFEYPDGKFIAFEQTTHNDLASYTDRTGCVAYGSEGSVFFGAADDIVVKDSKGKVLRTWERNKDAKIGSLTNPTAELDILQTGNFVESIRTKDQSTNSPADEAYMSTYLPLISNIAIETDGALNVDPKTGHPVNSAAAQKRWAREYEKGWELA